MVVSKLYANQLCNVYVINKTLATLLKEIPALFAIRHCSRAVHMPLSYPHVLFIDGLFRVLFQICTLYFEFNITLAVVYMV